MGNRYTERLKNKSDIEGKNESEKERKGVGHRKTSKENRKEKYRDIKEQ